jgi:SAM-dependent methyltransferase
VEPEDLRSSYDAVAESYAAKFFDELSRKPFDRDLLERFARECPPGRVLDVGCGPGHVGRFLADQAVDVTGVDLAPAMIEVARRLNEGMRFDVGDMRHLDYRDGEIAGIVAFYSLIHIPRDEVPAVLRELHRVMARDGRLLLAVHGGSGSIVADEFLGHEVRFEATLFELRELEELVEAAGFRVDRPLQREPYEFEAETPRLYLAATRMDA